MLAQKRARRARRDKSRETRAERQESRVKSRESRVERPESKPSVERQEARDNAGRAGLRANELEQPVEEEQSQNLRIDVRVGEEREEGRAQETNKSRSWEEDIGQDNVLWSVHSSTATVMVER